jgi:hypothetical protein
MKVYLVISQTKDGTILPLKAYDNEEKAVLHVENCNHRPKDEDGYEMLSTAEKLNCFAWLKVLNLYS